MAEQEAGESMILEEVVPKMVINTEDLPESPFKLVNASFVIPVVARFADCLLDGVIESLSRMIFRHSKEIGGVPISFDNVQLDGEKHRLSDALSTIFVRASADFLIFAPHEGDTLIGSVTLVSSLHVAFLIHDSFHGVCTNIAECLKVTKDAEGQLSFNDGEGDVNVQVGSLIKVRVQYVERVKHGVQLNCSFIGVV